MFVLTGISINRVRVINESLQYFEVMAHSYTEGVVHLQIVKN